MKNKNGFTLVELLAVIGILALLVTIVTPNLMKTFNNKKQILYDDTVKEIERFAGIYLADNPDLYTNISNRGYVNVPTTMLCEDKYLECPLSDPRDNKEINGYVKVTYENNKYVYKFYNEVYINENVLITLQLNGGAVSKNQSGSYKEGTVIDLETPIKTNATFSEWEVIKGNSNIVDNKLTVGSKDSIIYAKYEAWSTLTINLDGGTISENPSGIYKNGTIVELKEPTKLGYIFTGWKLVEGDGILSGNKATIGNTNTILTATWELNVFNLSVKLNGGSINQNPEGEHTVGSIITLETPTRTGYTFTEWSVLGEGAILSGENLTIGTSDVTLTANWQANSYTYNIVYKSASGVSLGSATETFSYATINTIRPKDVTGYTSPSSQDVSWDSVDSKTITFTYEPITYTISYTLSGGNSTNVASYTIETETFTLNNPTRDLHTFTGWIGSDLSSLSKSVSIAKGSTGNRTYTARWEVISPVGSYSCSNGSKGSAPYVFKYTSECTVINDSNGNWRVKFLKSGTLTPGADLIIDAFLVGGGGAGGAGVIGYIGGGVNKGSGGGGGGGGFTITQKYITLTAGKSYGITVGAGATSAGAKGGSTTAFSFTAEGGNGGSKAASGLVGANGGTGGSNGGNSNSGKTKGTSPGYNGNPGQGTTTREFGETSGTMYSGGGAPGYGYETSDANDYGPSVAGGQGGGANSGKSALANTGGGGGGAIGDFNTTAGSGGSGIVVIRNTREKTDGLENTIPKITYTGSYVIVNDNDETIGFSADNWKIKFLTSGTLVFTDLSYSGDKIDVFLVGGGGAGGNGSYGYIGNDQSSGSGGGGGGGGFTTTQKNVSITQGTSYKIVVGNGGTSASAKGQASTAFNFTAEGGNGGSAAASALEGGAGGTGGSNGGASKGGNTTGASPGYNGNPGQGTTTGEFGVSTAKLYSGGGAPGTGAHTSKGTGAVVKGGQGGGGDSGNSGLANTGGGGGGATAGTYYAGTPGSGGSGIVIIRNKR